MSDRQLIQHVLEGQRELQVSVSEVHLVVAEYHAEAKRGNETMGVYLKHLSERCEGIEEAAKSDRDSTEQALSSLRQRVDAAERKLLIAATACMVTWTIGGLVVKYGAAILKVLG